VVFLVHALQNRSPNWRALYIQVQFIN